MYVAPSVGQKTGRTFVVNTEADAEKDKDMVQRLLGRWRPLSARRLSQSLIF